MGVKAASDGWFRFPIEIKRELGARLRYHNSLYVFSTGGADQK
jgi:hypothetical protein